MPIYEFYCRQCHRIFNFLSRTVNPSATPACPRCGRGGLERRASSFAVSKGRGNSLESEGSPDLDPARLEQAMGSLAREAEALDENDPRHAAQLLRRLYGAAGLAVGPRMAEALRRMEAGEDPEAIEDELGDALDEEDPLEPPSPGSTVKRARRRWLPPSVDPELHEL
jgi:putative FmdB family regulatory protein